MFKKERHGSYKISVLTKDKELEEKIFKLKKEKDKYFLKSVKEGDICPLSPIDEDYIAINTFNNHSIILVANDVNLSDYNNIDKEAYFIKILNKGSITKEEYDSYIYTDDYHNAILDLINALYGTGIVCCFDGMDLMKLSNEKSFNHYKFIYNKDDNFDNFIKDINFINKTILLVLYGNYSLRIKDVNNILEKFKGHTKESWVSVNTDLNLKDNEVLLSIFVEK